MGNAVTEEGKITFARIVGKDIAEGIGNFPDSLDILWLAGSQTQFHSLGVDMDIQGNQKLVRGNVLPQAQIHLAVVTDHPAPEHVDFLVRRLCIFLLSENQCPDFRNAQ